MNKDIVQKIEMLGIDYSKTISRFFDSDDFFLEVLELFTKSIFYDDLVYSIKALDYNKAYVYAHSLKGETLNLGIEILNKELIPFSEFLRKTPCNEEKIQEHYNRLVKNYEFCQSVLKSIFA